MCCSFAESRSDPHLATIAKRERFGVDRDFGNQLYAHGSDPLLWRERALELKMAADALLPHYFDAVREPPSSPGAQRRKFAFFHGYLLLMGFAVENALKGLRVAEDPSLVTRHEIKPMLGRGGHGIKNGLERYLSLDPDEVDVATRLEEFLVWAAKYSVPLKVSDLANAETKLLRTHISNDPDTLNGIFARLLELYPRSASPYAD